MSSMSLLCLLLCCCCVQSTVYMPFKVMPNASDWLAPRTLGGKKARLGQFPFQVSLRQVYNDQHTCGGALLTPNWVVTTAHCVTPSQQYVMTQTVSLNTQDGQKSNILRSVVHPEYDAVDRMKNNIALRELETAITLGEGVGKCIVPAQDSGMQLEVQAMMSGWGYHTPSIQEQTIPNYLNYQDNVQTMDNEKCGQLTGIEVPPGNLCAGVNDKGTCQGDDSSPLSRNNILFGLLSYVYLPCGSAPDFFTRISPYTNWIYKTLGEDSKQLRMVRL